MTREEFDDLIEMFEINVSKEEADKKFEEINKRQKERVFERHLRWLEEELGKYDKDFYTWAEKNKDNPTAAYAYDLPKDFTQKLDFYQFDESVFEKHFSELVAPLDLVVGFSQSGCQISGDTPYDWNIFLDPKEED